MVLVIYGLVDSGEAHDRTGGIDANLWSGIVMVVVAAGSRCGRGSGRSSSRRRRSPPTSEPSAAPSGAVAHDGRILKALAGTHDLMFGLQAHVVRGGTVRRGDPAVLR